MKLNTVIIAATATALLAMASCKKANNNQNDTVKDQNAAMKKISAVANGLPDMPTVENGILTFESQEQFAKYIAFLDAAVDPKSYDSATLREKEFDQDEILETIENYLGFTSIRKISHDHFMQLNETGWDRLEDIPEEHFIRDAVMRSVLNKDLTVQIANNYVHCINKDLVAQVDITQPELLNKFNSLPTTTTLNDALLIDPTSRFSTLFETLESGELATLGKVRQILGEGDLSIIGIYHDKPDCYAKKTIVFRNIQLWQETTGSPSAGSLPGTFEIDFGDGTQQVIHSEPWGNLHIVPAFGHVYATIGNYIVKIHAIADYVNPGATSNDADLDYPITVTEASCQEIPKRGVREVFPVPDGTRAVVGEISVELPAPFFGSEKTRFISETWSYYQTGNKWRESKAEI